MRTDGDEEGEVDGFGDGETGGASGEQEQDKKDDDEDEQDDKEHQEEEDEDDEDDEEGEEEVMVPLADMLNAAYERDNVSLGTNDSLGPALRMGKRISVADGDGDGRWVICM